jgi:Peptidase M50B-like
VPGASPIATVGDVATRIWDDLTGTQPAPSDQVIWALAAAALAIVGWSATWPLARHLVTMAHEGAHGLVATLAGRRQRGISLHVDTSGRARSHGPTRGPGLILTTAAGYPGPALLGLGAALLLGGGHALAVLWAGVALLALLLIQIRNAWGIVVVLAAGGALFAISWSAPEQAQSLVAYAAAWFLLIAAPRPVLELAGRHRRGQRGSDADVLAKLTHVPAVLWIVAFLAITLGALLLGGWALIA